MAYSSGKWFPIVAVTGTFLNTLKFNVKDCDPDTGEPDDDVGYADEYVVSGCGYQVGVARQHSVLIFTFCGSVQFFTSLKHR